MKIGVIGAGTMGQGIAKAFAQVEGNTVALCDIKQEWAENGLAKIKKGYEKLVAKGKMTQEKADAIVAAITPGLKEDLCADCDLVVEAAFEDMKVKQTTFGELDKICKPECIFASNTSSLSITEIGKGVSRPLVGMHFFNPADRMKLIEVIAGCNTPAETVEKIKEISVAIGKQPVQVNEAAGFVVNRILIPMINEAAFIKMEGVSDIAGIDTAMKLGANHPMGPLELGDFIGLDICLHLIADDPELQMLVDGAAGRTGRVRGADVLRHPHGFERRIVSMLIYLLRHGQTEYNAQKRYQGQRDIPLSPEGAAQLRRADFDPDVVYVSTLQRTSQTARILFPEAKLVPVDGLKEMCFGSFEGRNFIEMEKDPEYQAWVKANCESPCPDGERKTDFSDRICRTVAELIDKALAAGEERLVILAHGGTQMAAMERFAVPHRDYYAWCGPNAGGFVLNAKDWTEKHLLYLVKTVQYTKESRA